MKNGICKYDGKTFTEYTPKDGLGGTEFWGIIIEQSGVRLDYSPRQYNEI
jgi:hypothetical protein